MYVDIHVFLGEFRSRLEIVCSFTKLLSYSNIRNLKIKAGFLNNAPVEAIEAAPVEFSSGNIRKRICSSSEGS